MILVIDHYDSFIDMICDYLRSLGQNLDIIKTDNKILETLDLNQYSRIVIGPGPGHPEDIKLQSVYNNILPKAIQYDIPVLGICLGHQIIAKYYGAKIKTATQICHGRVQLIKTQNDSKIFYGLPQQFQVTRYHSLIIDSESMIMNQEIRSTANTPNNEIMAIEHLKHKIYGVQFHPESIMSEFGHEILNNFLSS